MLKHVETFRKQSALPWSHSIAKIHYPTVLATRLGALVLGSVPAETRASKIEQQIMLAARDSWTEPLQVEGGQVQNIGHEIRRMVFERRRRGHARMILARGPRSASRSRN